MSIFVNPMVNFIAEHQAYDTQLAFSGTGTTSEAARYLENKAALLVVVDASDNILLSLVGKTEWSTTPMENDAYRLQHRYFRSDYGSDITSTAKHTDLETFRPLCPLVPALRFTPMEQFMATIRNTGLAAKAYLIVDTLATRSQTDIALWEPALWEGTSPLDIMALPESVKYIQLGVGDTVTDQPVRLTNTSIDVDHSVVQLADGFIQLYFTNMYNDWSGMREAMDARLAAIPSIGKTLQDIADKEAIAFG